MNGMVRMTRAPQNTEEWQLFEFADPTLVDGCEVRVSHDGRRALVIWPWHTPCEQYGAVVDRTRSMGFKFYTEFGNMLPYSVFGADTDDSDYVLLEAE